MKKFLNRETVSYLVVGICTTVVGLAVFALAVHFGMGVAVSNTASHALATLFAYITNKVFVFRSRSWNPRLLGKEFVKFIGARLFTYIGETALLVVLVDIIGLDAMIMKMFTMGLVVLGNYFFSKFFVFKK